MKYKVEGTMHFEGVVEIKDPEKTLKDFNRLIFETDMEGLASHIVTSAVAREMDFVEGVGDAGSAFIITEDDTRYDDPEVTEVID